MATEATIHHYRVRGSVKINDERVTFTKYYRGLTEEDAKEKLWQHFGSKHRIRRFSIKIHEVTEVPAEEFHNLVEASVADEAGFKRIV